MHTDDFMQLLVSTVTAARGGNAEASPSSSRSHARRVRRGRLLNKLRTKEPPASSTADAHNPTTPTIHQPSTPTTPPGATHATKALLDVSLDSAGAAEISFETQTEEAAPEDEPLTESRNNKILPRFGSVYNNHTFKPTISHSTPPGWPPTTYTNQRPPARELSPNSITRCKALSSHKITSDLTIGDVARVAAAELLGRKRTEYIFIHDHSYPAAEANMGSQRRTFRRHPRPPLQTIAPPARPSQPKVPPSAQPTQPRARKTTSTATVTDENPGFEPSPPRQKTRKHTSPPPTPPAAPPAHPTRLKLAFGTPIKRD